MLAGLGAASLFCAQGSTFNANLSVSVIFPAVGALPPNVSIAAGPGSGAAPAILPACMVAVLAQPAGGICANPTDSYMAPVGAASTLTFTAGPVSGFANPGGAVTATSTGVSEEVILGNLNPFAVALPLNLSYTANLGVTAAALEFSSATYSFNVTNNGASILPGGPNTFTLNCAACGAMNAVNPVPLPPNPVMVLIPAAGVNPGFAFIRIDPLVSGIAISDNIPIPEPGTWLLGGSGMLLLSAVLRLRSPFPLS
jgi:hypothetical protein